MQIAMTDDTIEIADIDVFMTTMGYIAFDSTGLGAEDSRQTLFQSAAPLGPRPLTEFLDDMLQTLKISPDTEDIADLKSLLATLAQCSEKVAETIETLEADLTEA